MGRAFTQNNNLSDENTMGERPHGRGHGGHGRGHRRGKRLFDYGELRLLVLALIAEQPAHGYELIKLIEERFGGNYTPSPGVIYPTLAWLVDMGYANVEAEQGGRKSYAISPEGQAFLTANQEAADSLLARTGSDAPGKGAVPAPVLRAMENLKTALRLRIGDGPIDKDTAQAIAAIIDGAAQQVDNI